jgi:hypothetical protein
MSPTLTCIALAFAGVDIGYRPAPDGGLELIVQIDSGTFQTLRENDPITLAVPREAQQVRPSQVTVALGNLKPPRNLPPQAPPPVAAPPFRASAPPAAAPDVQASPLLNSPVRQANAALPIPTAGGPELGPANGQGPVRVAPPSGPTAVPRTTNEQSQGAADPRSSTSGPVGGQLGASRIGGIPPLEDGNAKGTMSGNGVQLRLMLVIIALAASNGYVGWLFYDARQRYLALLARAFAPAGQASST